MTPRARAKKPRTPKRMSREKPAAVRIFLGAASENDRMLQRLGKRLSRSVIVKSWRTVFRPGESALESLRRAATTVDFAAFIWGRDDLTVSRKKAKRSPRDNVVYEAGLFAGYLGSRRTFVIPVDAIKMPTDYLGVTTIPKTTIDALAARIEDAMADLGPVPTAKVVGSWWQFVTSGDLSRSVVSFFDIAIGSDSRLVSIEGTSWNRHGRVVATWHSPAAALDEGTMTLHYSYEGEHPREQGFPTYFGVGEIKFRREPFVGSFSATQRLLKDATVLRRARYMRAEPGDAATIHGTNANARTRLILQRLRQRAQYAET